MIQNSLKTAGSGEYRDVGESRMRTTPICGIIPQQSMMDETHSNDIYLHRWKTEK